MMRSSGHHHHATPLPIEPERDRPLFGRLAIAQVIVVGTLIIGALVIIGFVILPALSAAFERPDPAVIEARRAATIARIVREEDDARWWSGFWRAAGLAGLVLAVGGGITVMVGRMLYDRPDQRGLLSVPRKVASSASVGALAAYHETQRIAAQNPHPHLHSLSVHNRIAGDALVSEPQPAPVMQIPAPSGASFALIPGKITLGFDAATGNSLNVSPSALCHTAASGQTGQGKSVWMRWIAAQLLGNNESLIVLDPHFQPNLWGPAAVEALAIPPVYDPPKIESVLSGLVDEMERRRSLMNTGQQDIFDPIFVMIDELILLKKAAPRIIDLLEILLRGARKYGIFVLTAAQDFLVSSLATNGGVRECLVTAMVTGGEHKTIRSLLNITGPWQEPHLGDGTALLRSGTAIPEARLVKTPLCTADDLTRIVGARTPSKGETRPAVVDVLTALPDRAEPTQDRAAAVLQLRAGRTPKNDILKRLWGVTPGGSAAYRSASAEYEQIIASAPAPPPSA